MNEEFVMNRITELRRDKHISESQMSQDLGYGEGYIHNLLAGKFILTIPQLLLICSYFEITPHDFFDENLSHPALVKNISNDIRDLNSDDLHFLENLIAKMKK